MTRIEHLAPVWHGDPLAGLRPASPRLLLDGPTLARIAEARQHPVGRRLWDDLVARGERQLADPPLAADAGARTVLDRVYTLALLARITGEGRWAERILQDLDGVIVRPDWNPGHWLSVAEMMHAVAVAIDWLGPWLGDRRARLVEALIAKGLDAADHAYACRTWWWRDTANWNVVCNGGVIIACLVLADERPVQCRRLMGYALQGLPLHLGRLFPDGGHEEGPGYWGFTWRYASVVIAMLRTAVGHDFGFAATPGLAPSAWFRVHHQGPAGEFFAWADSYREAPFDPTLLWLAREYGHPAVAAFARRSAIQADRSPFYGAIARALLFWNAEGDEAELAAAPRTARFRGPEVAVTRSGWDDAASWIALKGGDVQAPHAHQDCGAVVADAAGVRWLADPGAGVYDQPGYWNGRPDTDGARWRIWECSAAGHCTLLVNGQGCHPLTQMELTDDGDLAVESRSAFADHGITRWRRSIRLASTGLLEVMDELDCTRPATIRLNWITAAAITIADRTAVLTCVGHTATLSLEGAGAPQTAAGPLAPWRWVAWDRPVEAGTVRFLTRLAVN